MAFIYDYNFAPTELPCVW